MQICLKKTAFFPQEGGKGDCPLNWISEGSGPCGCIKKSLLLKILNFKKMEKPRKGGLNKWIMIVVICMTFKRLLTNCNIYLVDITQNVFFFNAQGRFLKKYLKNIFKKCIRVRGVRKSGYKLFCLFCWSCYLN